MKLTRTGIAGLDSILNGGLVTESTVLISGNPGTGKTILGIQYLYNGVTKFNETGGVVVWRASDTSGAPPAELAQRFPGLVPEVPRAFDWLVTGRQPLLRVGWAIVRPRGP